MADKTDDELVERGMAVVRPMIEDSQRFRAWLDANRRDTSIYVDPSRWESWRAGKADLAQQVVPIMAAFRALTDAANALWDADADESGTLHDQSRLDCTCRSCRITRAWPPLIDAIVAADTTVERGDALLRAHGARATGAE